jgi:hypothetical protein
MAKAKKSKPKSKNWYGSQLMEKIKVKPKK